jgi:alcohol dehydrogenase class IV
MSSMGSLVNTHSVFEKLQMSLATNAPVVHIKMEPHIKWSEIVEIAKEVYSPKVDMIVTPGGSSLTRGTKTVTLPCNSNTT